MQKGIDYTKKLVLTALMAALVSTIKLLMAFLPNVEVVTLLIVAFTYVFGIGLGMGTTLVFCLLEGLIWGFNPSWLLSYFIHWPVVACTAFLLKKSSIKHPIIIALALSVLTALFGWQSTFMYMLTGGGLTAPSFGARYIAMYLSGVKFYAVHTISCFVSISIGFVPLTNLLTKLGKMYLPRQNIG